MIPVNVTGGGANHSSVTSLLGFSVREDASATAEIEFRKLSATGQIIAVLNLAADESATIFFPKAVSSPGGVYVKETSGSITGVLFANN